MTTPKFRPCRRCRDLHLRADLDRFGGICGTCSQDEADEAKASRAASEFDKEATS